MRGAQAQYPCGAALGKTVLEAYQRAHLVDPVSIFGGIVGCNKKIDRAAAEEMIKTFLEVVVAPDFDQDALDVFAQKKNLRLIKADVKPSSFTESLSVDGGLLVQERDNPLFSDWKVVTKKKPTPDEAAEMAFGMTIALFVKSNAIVIVKDRIALGIAGGQVNRIWPTAQSLERAKALTDQEPPILPAQSPKRRHRFSYRMRSSFADVVDTAANLALPRSCSPAAPSATRNRSTRQTNSALPWSLPAPGTSNTNKVS